MRRLWPDPADVPDVNALVAAEERPAAPDRPWLLVNMVTSLDGAISVDGRSAGLAGPADKAVFVALRGIADVVLAGAGTVRAERYGPPSPSEETRAARAARGQAEVPRIAIVTRSLDLDASTPLFQEAAVPPLVITCDASDPAERDALADHAEVLVAGDRQVDLAEAFAHMRRDGVEVITCEGGPHLNGFLIGADLVDEWDLTLSPMLVGDTSGGASQGLGDLPRPAALTRLLEDDGVLLGRWVRDRAS